MNHQQDIIIYADTLHKVCTKVFTVDDINKPFVIKKIHIFHYKREYSQRKE